MYVDSDVSFLTASPHAHDGHRWTALPRNDFCLTLNLPAVEQVLGLFIRAVAWALGVLSEI
jgi:hypothetical protein